MIITNLEKGEAYNLKPDTKIEIERTNPFFNDYGEQSTPLELPASERNRRILNFPDTFGRNKKAQATEVSITDGEYFAQCRQIVLSAQHKESISTSFYINDGSFYSRIQNVKLKDIFGSEVVPGVNGVEQCIDFCRKLRAGTDNHFGIFPVLLTNDSGLSTGFNYKILNAFGHPIPKAPYSFIVVKDGQPEISEIIDPSAFLPDENTTTSDFYNAVQRTEYVGEVPITLAPGYYISPFIRANYLLQRIFNFFGYQLQDNFFTRTEPFNRMVILNNVIDVLVNGKIKLADLVPDITCADMLALFRKKFCLEFTSNEGSRTADIVFLRETLAEPPVVDLTRSVTAEPIISYKSEKDYKRIVLAPTDRVDSEITDSYDDLDSMYRANPTAFFNYANGSFYKRGFSGDYEVITKIGEASQAYNTGEKLEAKEIKIPEVIPEFRDLEYRWQEGGTTRSAFLGHYLFVGSYQTLNSKLVVAGSDKEQTSESANKQHPQLAFTYNISDGRPEGTISSSDVYQTFNPVIFQYSLFYNGYDGIFERFYRDYDNLLRNSLHETKVRLLLSGSQKQNLPAWGKVIIRSVPFFFNKLKFSLGGKTEPIESELLSLTPMEPLCLAPQLTKQLPAMLAKYRWEGHMQQTEISADQYWNSGPDRDRTFTTVYPPLPDAQFVGKPYLKQTSCTARQTQHRTWFRKSKWAYTRTEVWLECVKIL